MLKIGFTVYIAPILMMILGYTISSKMGGTEKVNVLVSFAFLVISFICLHIYDKYFVKEKVEMKVTAVEKGTELIDADSCTGKK